MPEAQTLTPATPVYLSPAEQQAIISSLPQRGGWTVIGGAALPEQKMGQDNLGRPSMVTTGRYSISIADANGNTQQLYIRKGNPLEDGTPTWLPEETPDTLPKPTQSSLPHFQGNDGREYYPSDPNDLSKPWLPQGPSKVTNPDEDITTAVNRQNQEALRNERAANAANGKGYMTDQERIAIEQRGRQLGQTDDQNKLDKQKFEQAKRIQDSQEARAAENDVAQRGNLAAQTNATNVQSQILQQRAPGQIAQTAADTQLSQAQAGRIQGLLPSEIEQAGASTAKTRADTAAVKQGTLQGAQPQPITAPGQDQPYYAVRDPNTGAITFQDNPNFIPKTQPEIAARVGQLQKQASTEMARLSQLQKQGVLSDAQRDAQWQQWWNQNIEPQKQALDMAQRQAVIDQSQKEQEQARLNYSTAQQAGQNAVDAYKATLPYRVGPGFGNLLKGMVGAWKGGAGPSDADVTAGVTFQMPDLNQLAQNATAQALQHISPTAAAMAGGGPPALAQAAPTLDLNAMLNRTSFGAMNGAMPADPQQAAAAAGAAQQLTPQQIAARSIGPFAGPPVPGAFGATVPSPAFIPPPVTLPQIAPAVAPGTFTAQPSPAWFGTYGG